MPDWRCEVCGVVNLEGQRSCESCGREPASTAVQSDPAPVTTTREPCAWKTNGRACQMVATIWKEPIGNYKFNKFGQVTGVLRPGYCGWHFECLSSPRLADDFDEFERLQTIWLKRPYCNQFVHHPADYVWQALRGHLRAPEDRMTVRPCNAHDCWVPDVITATAHDHHPLSAKESVVRIAGIVRDLSRRMAVRLPVPTEDTA